ncbi:MAG TPA: hypothetical protein V6D19_05330 [Stenomitos sp.]
MTHFDWTLLDDGRWSARALRGEEYAVELYLASDGDRPVEALRKHIEFLTRNLNTVEQRIENFIYGARIPMKTATADFSVLHDERRLPIIHSITVEDPSQPTYAYVEFSTLYPDVYCLYTAELDLLEPIRVRGEMW